MFDNMLWIWEVARCNILSSAETVAAVVFSVGAGAGVERMGAGDGADALGDIKDDAKDSIESSSIPSPLSIYAMASIPASL